MRRLAVPLSAALLFAALPACASPGGGGGGTDADTGAGAAAAAGAVAAEGLKERLQEFSRNFSLRVQVAARDAYDRVRDPGARRNAVLWELNATAFSRSAAFQDDAGAALIDVFALCVQMRAFFETGEGRGMFGEHTGVALDAARELEQEIAAIAEAATPGGSFPAVKAAVEAFASARPARRPFARASIRPYVAARRGKDPLAWILEAPYQPLRAFGGMDETARAIFHASDVAEEVGASLERLPADARLHAEILLSELEASEPLLAAVRSVDSLAKSATRASETAAALPAEVRREATALLDEVERTRAGLNETLGAARSALEAGRSATEEARAALPLVREAAAALAASGASWEKTFQALRELVRDLEGDAAGSEAKGEAAAAAAEEGEPFRITDVTEAARELGVAAVEVRGVLGDLRDLLAAAPPTAVATHLAGLAAAVIVVFFAALLGYRLAAARLLKPPRA